VERLFERTAPLNPVSVRVLSPPPPATPAAPAEHVDVRTTASAAPPLPHAARQALSRAEISHVAQKVIKLIRAEQRLERESKGLF
jgi:hypothetical protein